MIMTLTTRQVRHVTICLAAAGALLPAMAACSSSGGGKPAAKPAATPASTVPQYVASENARESVTDTGCKSEGAKGWRFTGTVKNGAAKPQQFTVVVDFVDSKGDTVLATKVLQTAVLTSHKTAALSATGAAGHTDVSCVIREALSRA
jgi:hypothetical protein